MELDKRNSFESLFTENMSNMNNNDNKIICLYHYYNDNNNNYTKIKEISKLHKYLTDNYNYNILINNYNIKYESNLEYSNDDNNNENSNNNNNSNNGGIYIRDIKLLVICLSDDLLKDDKYKIEMVKLTQLKKPLILINCDCDYNDRSSILSQTSLYKSLFNDRLIINLNSIKNQNDEFNYELNKLINSIDNTLEDNITKNNATNNTYYDCILLYDEYLIDYATSLHDYLTQVHDLNIWIDIKSLNARKLLNDQYIKAIKNSKLCIFLLNNTYFKTSINYNCAKYVFDNHFLNQIIVINFESLDFNRIISTSNIDNHDKVISCLNRLQVCENIDVTDPFIKLNWFDEDRPTQELLYLIETQLYRDLYSEVKYANEAELSSSNLSSLVRKTSSNTSLTRGRSHSRSRSRSRSHSVSRRNRRQQDDTNHYKYDIFISYLNDKNRNIAHFLYKYLTTNTKTMHYKIWFLPKQILNGNDLKSKLKYSLLNSKLMISCITNDYLNDEFIIEKIYRAAIHYNINIVNLTFDSNITNETLLVKVSPDPSSKFYIRNVYISDANWKTELTNEIQEILCFMNSPMFKEKLDIYLSYHDNSIEYAFKLYKYLIDPFNCFNTVFKVSDLVLNQHRPHKKIIYDLKRSKIMLCLITNDYFQSKSRRNELIIANKYKIPIVYLLIDSNVKLNNVDEATFQSKSGTSIQSDSKTNIVDELLRQAKSAATESSLDQHISTSSMTQHHNITYDKIDYIFKKWNYIQFNLYKNKNLFKSNIASNTQEMNHLVNYLRSCLAK